jgi:hypothetical protein
MARGNGRMAIFLDDRDYRQFIQLLHAALALFGDAERSTLRKRFANFVLAGSNDMDDDRIRSTDLILGGSRAGDAAPSPLS